MQNHCDNCYQGIRTTAFEVEDLEYYRANGTSVTDDGVLLGRHIQPPRKVEEICCDCEQGKSVATSIHPSIFVGDAPIGTN